MSARESIVPVFVPHLGCPNDCVFCNQRRISGSLAPARPEDVARAIENAACVTPEGTRRQLAFYGGSFTAIPDSEQEALLGTARLLMGIPFWALAIWVSYLIIATPLHRHIAAAKAAAGGGKDGDSDGHNSGDEGDNAAGQA